MKQLKELLKSLDFWSFLMFCLFFTTYLFVDNKELQSAIAATWIAVYMCVFAPIYVMKAHLSKKSRKEQKLDERIRVLEQKIKELEKYE